MQKTGQVDLPLHYGQAPKWLFNRMVKLARPLSEIIILEYGQDEFLRRLSEPYFFQALGCILGFDWHSSGLTTTTTGALKLALKDSGVVVAGGKGKASRKAIDEIKIHGEKFNLSDEKIKKLIYSSRISAKVDNSLIQDSYQLYHHSFFFNEQGKWAVVQQGMSDLTGYARRYHWLNDKPSYIEEPHSGIISQKFESQVMNLASKESRETRNTSLDIIKENPIHLKKFQENGPDNKQKQLSQFSLPARHEILKIDLGNFQALEKAYEIQPKTFEELLMIKGVGAKTIRALALISSLVYGSSLSWKDPAKYSYAHGGKDGIPFPVDKELYDKNIQLLQQAVSEAKLKYKEKLDCLRRLSLLIKGA